ncbi:MAG: hypothetical protein ACTSQG_05225 [Promethearchaeota archaeon]
MQKREKTIEVFIKNCPKCDKPIEGYSESQVEYNLNIHMMAKHNIEDNKE